jgi:hypothetical protein
MSEQATPLPPKNERRYGKVTTMAELQAEMKTLEKRAAAKKVAQDEVKAAKAATPAPTPVAALKQVKANAHKGAQAAKKEKAPAVPPSDMLAALKASLERNNAR